MDKTPIWLKIGTHKAPIKKAKIPMIIPAEVGVSLLGAKLIKEYWEGIKFAIKFVDAVANKIKNKTITVKNILSNFPIISVGLTRILSIFARSLFKIISEPITIKIAKIENKIRLIIKLKFPFFNSLSFLTNLEKSPKLTIIIEK